MLLSVYSQCPNDFPEGVFEALKNYVINHRAPGGFLAAVLSNSLKDAVTRANPESLTALPQIVQYIHEHCPDSCCGSAEAVEKWIDVPNENRQALYLVVPELGG